MIALQSPGDIQVVSYEQDGQLVIGILVDSVQVQEVALNAHQLREYRQAIAAKALLNAPIGPVED